MRHFALFLGIAFLFTGCLSPTPPPLPTPPPQQSLILKWWKELHDPAFDALAHEALSKSLTLQMARERVLQAYASVANKQAALLPTLSLSTSGSVQNELKGAESYLDSYTASLQASYEIDLFGKKSDANDAATSSFFATQEGLHVSSISLIAELANTWYALAQKKQSLALLQEQLSVANTLLSLTKLKQESGKASVSDVWQQEQVILSLQTQRTTTQSDIEAYKRSLNLLLGRSALEANPFADEARLIELPPQPSVGIPATLLLNRPDVKQAYYNLAASHAALAEAVKNQYPSLNLSLSVGSLKTVTHFADILDTIIASAVASISGTLFDGEAKEALVKQAHALSKERSLNYKQTLLQAFYESQEALEREKDATLSFSQLNTRVLLARNIFERQREKYLYGVVEFLNVLNAQQSYYELEQTKLSKQLERIKYRIALHRSLAGGFMPYNVHHEWSQYD